MSKALELAKFGRETPPTGVVVGDSDAQTLSQKTFSDMPVFSSGTANSLAYLNGSKVLTADGALSYDGTTFSTSVSVNSQAATIYTRNTNTGTSAWAGLTVGNDIANNRAGILLTSSNRTASGFVGPQSTYFYNVAGLMSIVTESNNPIYIGTNNTTRITINGSGNVGIGTDPSTGSRLQVLGLTDFWNSTNTLLRVQHDGTRGRLQAYTGGATGNIGINSEGGNVGIGTDSPGAKLDVAGSLKSQGFTGTGSNISGGANQVTLDYLSGSGGARLLGWGPNTTTRGGIAIAVVSSDASLYTDAIRIDSNAVVGIGTTPNSNGKVSIYDTTVAKLFLTDSTLGTSYGGQLRGYGTTGAGGMLEFGVVDANVFNSAIKVYNQATQISFSINSGSNGATSERMRIDTSGNVLFNAYSNTGGGKLDITSNATAVIQARSTATGTGDGTADVTVTRAVTAGASWWANARYDAYSHTWGRGGSATSTIGMVLNGSGNLAIGTTANTAQKLNVNGSIWLLGNDDANYSSVVAARYDSTWGFTMQSRLNSATMSEFLGVYADSGGASPRLSLVGGNGWKVGIGTTTPWAKLQVTRSVNNTNAAATNFSDYQNAGIIIHNQDDAGTGNKAGLFFAFAGSPGILAGIDGYKEYGNWNTGLRFYTNNQTGGPSTGTLYQRMCILPNGNVGIGNSLPGKLLTVGGDTDVYVDMTASTGWVRSTVRNGTKAAFTGVYRVAGNGISSPGLFAHNSDLNAWDDLYINCHDDGSGGVGGGTANKIIMGGRVGIGVTTPAYPLHVNGPPKMTNSGFNFNSIDKDASSGTVSFTYGELGGGMDNMSAFIMIHIYHSTSAVPGKSAIWLGTRQAARGSGGTVTQISTTKENVTTLTVTTNGDGTVITTDGGANLRCRLTVLAGGGTSVPQY